MLCLLSDRSGTTDLVSLSPRTVGMLVFVGEDLKCVKNQTELLKMDEFQCLV